MDYGLLMISGQAGKTFSRMLMMAQVLLALLFAEPSLAQDFAVVLERAEHGDYNAQSYIGYCLLAGKGVTRDEKKACFWYQQVVNHPDADAKIIAHANLILGFMYFGGKGVEQDYRSALKCFEQAAQQGYTDAHISIGLLYAKGWGVQKDYQKALQWWQRAVAEGHPTAVKYVKSLNKLLNKKHG